jgi:uncharacterized protein YkwD
MKIQTLLKTAVFGLVALGSVLASVAEAQSRWSTIGQPLPSSRQTTQVAASQGLEQTVLTQINQYRASRGLPALTLDPRISTQALRHSQAMANGQVRFSHDGFDSRVDAIARTIPYRAVAENVAYNQGYNDPAQRAVQGWLKSPGHRKNIEGQFDLTGIGIARNAKGEYYFTQIFIKRR